MKPYLEPWMKSPFEPTTINENDQASRFLLAFSCFLTIKNTLLHSTNIKTKLLHSSDRALTMSLFELDNIYPE